MVACATIRFPIQSRIQRPVWRGQLSYSPNMASVVHVIVGLGNGGAEKTLVKISTLDNKNSHVVISLTNSGHHGTPMRASKGHLHCMGLRWWNLPEVLKKMRRLRCLREADVITAWMPHAIILAPFYLPKSKGIKLVINIRASSYGRPFTDFLRKSFLGAWAVFYGKLVDVVIFPGKSTEHSHRFLPIKREKFVVIQNGFSPEEAHRGPEQPLPSETLIGNPAKTSEIFIIGMFARWHPQKNHIGFLKALFLLSQDGVNFRAIMAGPNVDWKNNRLVRIVKRYGLEENVELLGAFKKLEGVSRLIDVHVVASTYGEAFPNVAAETMLLGVPNIVTDVGDASTVIGSTGWLVSSRNPLALCHALKEAQASKSDLRFKGESAVKQVLSFFPIDKMVGDYSNLYTELSH